MNESGNFIMDDGYQPKVEAPKDDIVILVNDYLKKPDELALRKIVNLTRINPVLASLVLDITQDEITEAEGAGEMKKLFIAQNLQKLVLSKVDLPEN